jgi:SAM-dependent methyltransferase
MSGFSAEWLALREPADHRARNRELALALSTLFAGRETVSVIDLGCGAGSNLRALAPILPSGQEWRLVDYDPALLATARERVAAWGDKAARRDDALAVVKADRSLTVRFRQADLATDLERVLDEPADLVTAAALFDLVSAGWIARFADAVAARRAVFFTALTYDGREIWTPEHPADAAMLAAFHAHQAGDKGFGPSAGPSATEVLARAFEARGYAVTTGESPWRLDPTAEATLVRELAAGAARAVRETGQVPDATVNDWLRARLAKASCTVGHTDLLAIPRG